jgi:predicted nucleic acid-binding protein
MLILADSGILLRFLERTDPQHAAVRQAVRTLRSRGDQVTTSPQNAAEFWNVCTRPATARGGFGLTVSEADRRLRIVERLFPILPDHPATYTLWRRLVITHAVQGVQVHDARLVAYMQAHAIGHILTLNSGDFARYPGMCVSELIDAESGIPEHDC